MFDRIMEGLDEHKRNKLKVFLMYLRNEFIDDLEGTAEVAISFKKKVYDMAYSLKTTGLSEPFSKELLEEIDEEVKSIIKGEGLKIMGRPLTETEKELLLKVNIDDIK